MTAPKRSASAQRLREYLHARQRAYSLVLGKDDAAVKELIQDLSNFCRADRSTFHQDARIHAVLDHGERDGIDVAQRGMAEWRVHAYLMARLLRGQVLCFS